MNKKVPKPLDAICRKAMSSRPEDRYQDARELAKDLERWLADEPVTAWSEPFPIRARRWLKRHRTMVASATVALFVSVAALVVINYLQHRKNEELAGKNKELHEANVQVASLNVVQKQQNIELADKNIELKQSNGRVEQNFGYARVAVKEMAQQAMGNPLLKRPGMVRLQKELLDKALHYYKNFLANQRGDDVELQEELLFAHFAVGTIADMTGAAGEAAEQLREALAVMERLNQRITPNLDRRINHATILAKLGLLECDLGRMNEGLVRVDEGIAMLDRLHKEHEKDPAYAVAIALYCSDAASRYFQLGRQEQAMKFFLRSKTLIEKAALMPKIDATDIRSSLSLIQSDLALFYFRRGEQKAALELSEKAYRTVNDLLKEHPDDAENLILQWVIGV